MIFKPLPGQSCSEVLEAADEDRHVGRYAESLQKFEWFFEHSRNKIGMGGVRLSFALAYWLELATEYQPAMTALISLRDRTASRCQTTCGDFKAFHELSALNRYLNASEQTIAVFLDIAKRNKNAATIIYHVAEPYLVENGLYLECGPFLQFERTIETCISALKIGKEHEETFAELDHSPPPLAEKMFREKMTRLVALLALNDRAADAEMTINRSIVELESDEFRLELQAALNGHLPVKRCRTNQSG